MQAHDILDLIPQRAPMVMVDRLLHCDAVVTETALVVRPDNIMVEEGALAPCGLIENVAQSCAARMGYLNLSAGQAVRVGVIGALRNMTVHALPPVGAELHTRIEITDEVFGMTLATATVHHGETLLLEGNIKIALL